MTMLAGQIKRFLGVGLLATAAHVVTATAVDALFDVAPLIANFCGFSMAVLWSYIGHTKATFAIRPRHGFHFPRFLVVSLIGLTLSSLITWWGVEKLGAPFALTMLLVAVVVPAFTFVSLKLWALKT
ncbi:GtrA family protein [Cognatishimia maritima]|uniref:Putative flippase GtrA (Transmembrane translocase of bactoprenol-linked glucose) n=1 Tax=Cognatishimia maritima TaxID=870908 RepID=A0A1M5WDH0_9RHOB|nr:GtrA family protein [Cognatishimia maritima]SHH85609.1 Putative flippase GtrA (transmembrane translocase of bactoprenol-linked glucose) [Cognatishimia maritima]